MQHFPPAEEQRATNLDSPRFLLLVPYACLLDILPRRSSGVLAIGCFGIRFSVFYLQTRAYCYKFAARVQRRPQLLNLKLPINMLLKLAAVATIVASVAAHATFQELWVNGVDQGSYCVRLPASNNPVTSVTSTVSNSWIYIAFELEILTRLLIGYRL